MMHNHAPFNPANRGFHAAYKPGEVNHCPGCGRTHWYIGTISAECAFCATALPYTGETRSAAPAIFRRGGKTQQAARGRFTINGRA